MPDSKPYDVLVAGHICLDVSPRFPAHASEDLGKLLRPGKLVQMAEVGISTGGAVSNTGIRLEKLGSRVAFCARVGQDSFGQLTIDRLRKSGNPQGIRVISQGTSSYTIVIAPPEVDRIFLHHPGVNNDFCADDIDPHLVEQCRHFHFGYPPLMRRMFENEGAELERVFRIAKDAGATTSCDMALPDPATEAGQADWPRILKRILPHIDLFLPSIEEALYMVSPDAFLKRKAEHDGDELIDHLTPGEYSNLADTLLDLGASFTTLKAGHRGLFIKSRTCPLSDWSNRELWCPAFATENFVSATGAGDSAIAGLLKGFLDGLPLATTLRAATHLAWQNVQQLDAVGAVTPWDETLRASTGRLAQLDPDLNGAGWVWANEDGLWRGPNDSLYTIP